MRLVWLLVLVGCGSSEEAATPDKEDPARPALAPAAGASTAPTIDRLDELRWVVDDSLVARIGAELVAGELAVELEGGRARLVMVPSVDWFGGLDLQVGDEIESVNGVALTGAASFRAVVAAIYQRREVKLALRRAGTSLARRYVLASAILLDPRARLPTPAPATPGEEKLIAAAKTAVRRTGEGAYDIDALLVRNIDATTVPLMAGATSMGIRPMSPVVQVLGITPYDRLISVDTHTVSNPMEMSMAIRDRQDGFALVVDRLDEPVTLRYRIVEGLGDQAALAEAFAALEDELTPYPPVAAIDIPKAGAPPGIDDGVQKTGDGTFTVKRSLLDAILSNPASVATGARVVPSVKDGKPNGFKLYAIRPTSVFTKLGFQNGDNIHAVAGMEIASADSALAIYTRLRRLKKKSIEIEITRRGKPVILTYRVVD